MRSSPVSRSLRSSRADSRIRDFSCFAMTNAVSDKAAAAASASRLQDYADDLSTVVKWLEKRQDVDPRRIAVAGHSEGGAVAMLAASREAQISKIVLIAAPGTRGSDLILEQQKHALDLIGASEEDRKAKVDLQMRIQEAVVTDKGWESIPPDLRAQADTPWFRSLLQFDPAKVMQKIEQPLLIIQGDVDQQVFPHHADQLAALARTRKKSPAG